ncbi:hypothetical protein [Janthinobacterium agaricidamnosum]|uniref:Uncharacterized protein n=1 Tax=Janthinobacterium agaricidamnosum NBRC 102515 = DSM 9628 TaxID=1349767 RepID=W0V670_9BURK|nr:hypothetical protein [Janthinobacterium agaricidamnosum]CDG82848.1 putative uncharacterized protein [Janthinobacterium agaricidamnosum NBRC 102515 = DSM 9628]
MHGMGCKCGACRNSGSVFEVLEWGGASGETPFSEAEEMELAMELLDVSSEAELEQFLGKIFKGAWKGIKKVGSVIGKVVKPLGGVLKGIAKTALPFVGGALGSMIPIPGVGTALGSALGGAVSKALELEFGDLEMEQQELEFEMARRFVRIARSAAAEAAQGDGGLQAVQGAVQAALQRHLPGFAASGAQAQNGRWRRRGNTIELFGG